MEVSPANQVVAGHTEESGTVEGLRARPEEANSEDFLVGHEIGGVEDSDSPVPAGDSGEDNLTSPEVHCAEDLTSWEFGLLVHDALKARVPRNIVIRYDLWDIGRLDGGLCEHGLNWSIAEAASAAGKLKLVQDEAVTM